MTLGPLVALWRHTWVNVFMSILIGIFLGLGIVAWQLSANDGLRLVVFGTGDAASVLITDKNRRILILSGNDDSLFANAIENELPIFDTSVDLLLVDSQASAALLDRARDLDPDSIVVLPSPDDDTISQFIDFEVPLGDDMALAVEQAAESWIITLRSGDSRIQIIPQAATAAADGDTSTSIYLTEGATNTGVIAVRGRADHASEPLTIAIGDGDRLELLVEPDRIRIVDRPR
jgi:hypothetical protein